MKTTIIKAINERGTREVARCLARALLCMEGPVVVGLIGDLGVGKTHFVATFLRSLGVRRTVQSPTFVLVREYDLPSAKGRYAHHVDVYRLDDPKELIELGLKETLADPRAIILIEWADRVRRVLPKSTIWVRLEHEKNKLARTITIQNAPFGL